MRDLREDLKVIEAATAGPWGWDANTKGHCIRLMRKSGWGDIVMDFRRWGMQGAAPAFVRDGIIEPIKSFLKPRAAHHPTFDLDVDHPDAQFIAEARTGWPYAINRALAAEARVRDLKGIINRLFTDDGFYFAVNTLEEAVEKYKGLKP